MSQEHTDLTDNSYSTGTRPLSHRLSLDASWRVVLAAEPPYSNPLVF